MSENNYGNNQGNAQNPYAAQQPNSSAQSSYGQDYGQAPAAQNTYGQDYGQSASAQNSYGQAQQNSGQQSSAQQSQYGQFGAQPSSQNAYGQNAAQGASAQNTYGQQQYGYGQDASYQAQPAQQNQYGYGQEASYQAQPADYNYQQNSYQQNSYQQQPQQDAYSYGQPAGYPYAAPIVKKAPGMALAAMILGIVGVVTGFFVFGALLGIAAIILGALSLKKVKEAGAGKGFAITGIVTGAVAVLFSLCMLFVYISVAQTAEKCLEVGTDDGHGNVVCQIGDNPNNRMTVPAHR